MPNNVIEIVLKAVDQATEPLKGVSKALSAIKGLIGGAIAGLGFKEFVDNIIEAQKESFQLENAIKTVGKTAGATLQEMTALADQIQRTTTFSDGAAKSATAFALRLGLTGDVTKRVVQDAANLAAGLGGDLVSSTEQLARAVANPERALLSLRTAGISFTGQQQFLIDKLVKTGQAAKAQEIILKAVESAYQNTAKEARDTLGGALSALTNNFKSLFEASSGDTSGFTKFINETADSLSTLKEALHGTLKANDDLNAGLKTLVTGFLIVKGVVENVITTVVTVVTTAFQTVGKLIGGQAAAIVAAVQGNFKQAFEILKDTITGSAKDAYDELSKGGDKITDDTSQTIEKIVKLWDTGARDIVEASEKASKPNSNKNTGPSKEQLEAIDKLFQQLKAKAGQLRIAATAPLEDMTAELEKFNAQTVLANLGISKLPSNIRKVLDEIQTENAAAAQRQVATSLQDQSDELKLQATLHGQILQDATDELHIRQQLRDAGASITDELKKQEQAQRGIRNQSVIADLQDQLQLAKLTSDELDKELNRRKLSADATDQQRQASDQLTDSIRHATSVTQTWNSIVSDVKEAFGNLLESGSLSIKSLTRTIIIELEKREIYEAIDNIAKYLRNAFKSASSSGGGGIGSTIIAGIGHLFGFAGGGHPKGLAVVGENGPELANFGGGGQVWNKSELAFAGAGGGISYAPQTYITIEAKDTDANSLRKEFYSVLALNNAKQEKNFQQTLHENGFGRMR